MPGLFFLAPRQWTNNQFYGDCDTQPLKSALGGKGPDINGFLEGANPVWARLQRGWGLGRAAQALRKETDIPEGLDFL